MAESKGKTLAATVDIVARIVAKGKQKIPDTSSDPAMTPDKDILGSALRFEEQFSH